VAGGLQSLLPLRVGCFFASSSVVGVPKPYGVQPLLSVLQAGVGGGDAKQCIRPAVVQRMGTWKPTSSVSY